ncbi:MAG: hypothetical protein ACLVAW_16670 [Eisenbergiella massiliensis]
MFCQFLYKHNSLISYFLIHQL